MISFLIALVIDGITFYVAMIYGSYSFALLGFAEAVFFVLAAVYLIYVRMTLHCELELPIRMVEQNSALRVQVQTQGGRYAGGSSLRFRVELGWMRDKRYKAKRAVLRGCLNREGTASCGYELICREAGRYELVLRSVDIYDLTGFFHIRMRMKQKAAIDVLPIIEQTAVRLTERVAHFVGDADVYDEVRPGHDSSETLQYRPFQEGDKIQSIHWKLSARTDELMVKESSLPKACPVTLLLVHGAGDYVKRAASLSFSMMDAGCPHYVSWYSGNEQEPVRLRVDNEESFYEFLLYYLKDSMSAESVDIREAYKEKYTSDLVVHVLYLAEDLALYQNGELAAREFWKLEVVL